jgi:colanic acid/amylovoran biosynthesis glycosyltransferase
VGETFISNALRTHSITTVIRYVNFRNQQFSTSPRRIAYLLSRYPAISHTFFLHEVLGLRELGFDIVTASINAPDRALDQLTPAEAEAAATTFYIKSVPRMRAMMNLLRIAFTMPGCALRAFRAGFRLEMPSLHKRLYSFFYISEAILLADWMHQRGITHLHIHFGGAVATVGHIASAAAQIPYSLTIHGPDEFFEEQEFHLRQKLESATFVVAISHYCRSQLMRIAAPAYWDRFETIRLGIRPELLPERTSHGRGDLLQIIMVGRLVPTKGPLLLLQAIERVRDNGIAVSLTLVGDGPERPDLEAYIRNHEMRDIVTLTGALNHDQTLFRVAAADLFVLASFAEGIPVSLMEAMALGVPCISTYIAGIPELIESGRDGILVPAGSVHDLTEAILRLARDSGLRRRLAEAACHRILREYSLIDNLKLLATTLDRRLNQLENGAGAS